MCSVPASVRERVLARRTTLVLPVRWMMDFFSTNGLRGPSLPKKMTLSCFGEATTTPV